MYLQHGRGLRCALHFYPVVCYACVTNTVSTAGANVNASTPQGRTVLHVAASQGHGNVIDFLLEKGRHGFVAR